MTESIKIKKKSKEIMKHLSPTILSVRDRYFLGFSIVLLLFLSWSGFLALAERPLSFMNIISIHVYVTVVIVDLLILLFPLVLIYSLNLIKNKTERLNGELLSLNQRMNGNIELANMLKNNQWDRLAGSGDVLSDTLIGLGESLRNTKMKEEEVNWITNGKEQISDLLRNSHNLEELSVSVIKALIQYTGGIQGAFYYLNNDLLQRSAMYAYGRRRFEFNQIPVGKGLIGAAAYERAMIYRNEIPDEYCAVTSGLIGEVKPGSIVIVPLLQEEDLQGVFEIAFLDSKIPGYKLQFANEVSSIIGQTIYNLKITTRTEKLLVESQEMTATLRKNEDLLRENAKEMIAAQEELERSNKMLESQVQEVANSRKRLEALLTNASEFISIYDENQELVFESPSVRRILGYSDDDNINGMDPDILTPRGYKTINSLFQYLLDTPGGEQTAQYTYLRKNGEKVFLETKGKNLLHDQAIRGLFLIPRILLNVNVPRKKSA
jgi:PAS domain S-box-containing protein